jgi:hypothetical protein
VGDAVVAAGFRVEVLEPTDLLTGHPAGDGVSAAL